MNDLITVTPNDINLIEAMDAPELFTEEGSTLAVDIAKAFAKTHKTDISTTKGQGDLRTFAANFNRIKAHIGRVADDAVSEQKKYVKTVNRLREEIIQGIEEVRIEVRKPLTDFEESEKVRKARNDERIKDIEHCAILPHDADTLFIRERNALLFGLSEFKFCPDYAKKADLLIAEVRGVLNQRLIAADTMEKQAAELAEMKAKEAERARQEEERAKYDAAAAAERQKLIDDAAAATARAEAAEKAAADAKAKAAESAAQAERDRLQKIEDDRIAAVAEYQRKKDEAARVAKEKADKEAAEAARVKAEKARQAEATKHRAEAINATVAAFVTAGLPKTNAEKAAQAVIDGEIPHVTFQPSLSQGA